MQGGENRKIALSSENVPVHPQPTNFMHVEYAPGAKDEMAMTKVMEHKVTKGEDAVTKFRVPY